MDMTRTNSTDSYFYGKSASRLSSSITQRSPNSKLKLSCDTCAKLKVKCPKQLPNCERCLVKGLPCVYSSTRRHRKRGRRRGRTDKPEMANHVCTFFLPNTEQPFCLPWQNTQFMANTSSNHYYCQKLSSDSYIDPFQTPAMTTNTFAALQIPVDVLTPPTSTLDVGWPSENDVLPSIEPSDSSVYADAYTESPRSTQSSEMCHPACLSSKNWIDAPPDFSLSQPSTCARVSDVGSGSSIQDEEYTAAVFENVLPDTIHLPRFLPETPQETCFDLHSTYYGS